MFGNVIDYAGVELNEDQVRCRVEELRSLVKDDKDIEGLRTDDTYLLRFLHATKFDVKAAYERIKAFYKHMVTYPEWFASGSPAEKKDILKQNAKAIIPGRDREGRRIFLTKFGNLDPNKNSLLDLIHLDDYFMESVLEEPETYSTGICCILDTEGYSLKMLKWLNPMAMKIGTKKEECYPCKEIVYHIVNTSAWVNAGMKLSWPFLSAETKERIKFHFNNWNSLHNYISPEVLPPEYGGTGPALNFEKLNDWLLQKGDDICNRIRQNACLKLNK